MKSKRASKISKNDKTLLISLARTVGSALGTVAVKTDVFSKPAAPTLSRTKPSSKANETRKKNKV